MTKVFLVSEMQISTISCIADKGDGSIIFLESGDSITIPKVEECKKEDLIGKKAAFMTTPSPYFSIFDEKEEGDYKIVYSSSDTGIVFNDFLNKVSHNEKMLINILLPPKN